MLASVRDESWLVVGNDENECSFRLEDNQLLIKMYCLSLFSKKSNFDSRLHSEKMIAHGVFAYMRAYSEFIYQYKTDLSTAIV